MSEPRTLGSAALVRLVAAREISTRIRDKGFIISSVVILLVIVGAMAFQVVVNSGGDESRIGVVHGDAAVTAALEAQGEAADIDVTVVDYDDEAAARGAVDDEDVDGALVAGDEPELLVRQSADSGLQSVVQGAVSQLALTRQLAEAGVTDLDLPEVTVTSLDPDSEAETQRVVTAIFGIVILYSLLILFGQFIAQGVVEEKASRVVELLLATMRPWQLLAGKILGLGVLALGQMVLIGAVGIAGALTFDLVDVPGDLIGTVVTVLAWFLLGYAFYAALFAVAASLVSRQEDLATVLMPTSMVLIVGFFIGIQAASDPDGLLARVTSFVPGVAQLVMPVRQAAGEVALWEVALSVAVTVLAVALVVRLGGRIYAGALLRTGGKIKIREALRAERV